MGFSPRPQIYARHVILNRLLNILERLPNELGLLVWDVYRPRSVQAKLFQWMSDEIRKKQPFLSDEDNDAKTRKYMSAPSVVGDSYCPPHLSGGAIDLTLFEINTNAAVAMGTPFDDCTERAHRDYFQRVTPLSSTEQTIQKYRNLLRSIMEEAGFTSYAYEWWHFDIGNLFWGQNLKQEAVFGPLFGDEEWPD